ncbi:hypothetical protein MHYP_G00077720 [Metynnis hypsauchen]
MGWRFTAAKGCTRIWTHSETETENSWRSNEHDVMGAGRERTVMCMQMALAHAHHHGNGAGICICTLTEDKRKRS